VKKVLALCLAVVLAVSLFVILTMAYPDDVEEYPDEYAGGYADYSEEYYASPAVIAAYGSEIRVYLDGAALEFDVPPMIIDNRTMVPMRAIFEAFGMAVDWNPYFQFIYASRGADRIKLRVGEPLMTVVTGYDDYYTENNQATNFPLDVPPQIVDNRTLVPLRAISEATGASVEWDEATRTVTIER